MRFFATLRMTRSIIALVILDEVKNLSLRTNPNGKKQILGTRNHYHP